MTGQGSVPLVSILLAVYEPEQKWLSEQLSSLERQTWPNLELRVLDDHSGEESFCRTEELLRRISRFPVFLSRNPGNFGSNRTFSILTEQAAGEFFAYCDQDDIWEPDKLEKLMKLFQPSVSMVYCDMSVIDGEGRKTADSLRAIRPRLRYLEGENLTAAFLMRNCAAGCSTVVRREAARKALPFPSSGYCDQWTAAVCAACGSVRFCPEPLVRYRIHDRNQSGILAGIRTKEDYRRIRLEPLAEQAERMKEWNVLPDGLTEFISARRTGQVSGIWRGRAFARREALFEIGMQFLPEPVFQKTVQILRGKKSRTGRE